jgi:choline dehydrogenase-like flavoprotein
MVVMVVQTHSRSTGTIRLRSTDPFDHPIIKPNYFDDPSDLKTMLAGTCIYVIDRTQSQYIVKKSLKIPNESPKAVNRRRTDNATTK